MKTITLFYGYLSTMNHRDCKCFCHTNQKSKKEEICQCHRLPIPLGVSENVNTILIASCLYEYEFHLEQFSLPPLEDRCFNRKLNSPSSCLPSKVRNHAYSKLYHTLLEIKKTNGIFETELLGKWETERRNFINEFLPHDPVCAQVIPIQQIF